MSVESINPKLRAFSQIKHIKPGKAFTLNRKVTVVGMYILIAVNLIAWLSILLLRSGDLKYTYNVIPL